MDTTLVAALNIAAFFAGQWLVTRRRWTGFLLWALSNALVAAACLLRADSATACMFLVYLSANLCSMASWIRKPSMALDLTDRADQAVNLRASESDFAW
jgi:nicotinamide riboside transporter PnuC